MFKIEDVVTSQFVSKCTTSTPVRKCTTLFPHHAHNALTVTTTWHICFYIKFNLVVLHMCTLESCARQVSNAVVQACIAGLEAHTSQQTGEDTFWSAIKEAVLRKAQSPSTASERQQGATVHLAACLGPALTFRDLLLQLRDSLLVQHSGSSQPGVSLSHSSLVGKRSSNTSLASNPPLPPVRKPSKPLGPHSPAKLAPPTTAVQAAGGIPTLNPSSISPASSGVALQNVDRITAGLTAFSQRISEVLEIVSTLAQFRRLGAGAKGLPRIQHNSEADEREDSREMAAGSEEVVENEEEEGGEEVVIEKEKAEVALDESEQTPQASTDEDPGTIVSSIGDSRYKRGKGLCVWINNICFRFRSFSFVLSW